MELAYNAISYTDQPRGNEVVAVWQKPPSSNFLKCNIGDAAFFQAQDKTGIGMWLGDHLGG